MRSKKKIQGALKEFVKKWPVDSGSGRFEAQTYLNELIACYGADRKLVGARFEDAQAAAHGIINMYWPGVCAVEMKEPSQADKLPVHSEQSQDYWLSLDDPPFVVLCNFQQFEVWERDRFKFAPPANFSLADLPDNYEKLIFLAGTDRPSPKSFVLKVGAVVAALGVFAVGMYLLWGVWDRRPVAAAFTRVGGATRVETALEASRFWLKPPGCVVKTRSANPGIMFAAASYAMIHDAPLLFTSEDRKQNDRVDTRIAGWQTAPGHPKNLHVVRFTRDGRQGSCPGKPDLSDSGELSTLAKSNQPLPPNFKRQDTLAPVVVFAAAIEPGDRPDVNVGMALAAHMARANGEKVSLVAVPHYLESDPKLEDKLEHQHELVTGGVVLGQTPTVPEDTRALLRQLLTSTDRQGVAARVQDNLGSLEPLIAALLALVGLGTAARIAAPIVIELLERNETKRLELLERFERINSAPIPPGEPPVTPTDPLQEKKSDWLIALDGNQEVVTIVLRSDRQVTGTVDRQFPENVPDPTVFRIKKPQDPAKQEEEYVLVSVKEIEQIHFKKSK